MPALPPPFTAPFAPDDTEAVAALLGTAGRWTHDETAVDRRARSLIEGIRQSAGGIGGVEDFLREFGLSSREGLALMILAEALLRVPDAATQDRLIEDKIGAGDWAHHDGDEDRMLTAASAWALGISARIIRPGETPQGVMQTLVKRLGAPAVRTATRQAMRFLGRHFVLGETIGDALDRARSFEKKGYRHSYDMLGEGARTAKDAARYFKSYADAIEAIGRKAGNKALPDRPGISVKLSALYPRYAPTHREAVIRDLVPKVVELATMAKGYDLNLTIDAEEAERLELSLDVINAVVAAADFRGWDGFGLAIQAYQKRTLAVIDHIDALAAAAGIRMMVRLVKGAYWDTEIKLAQEKGLAGYPVYSRKPATDLSYLVAARALLDRRPRLYPQFATHNALTVATIMEMAGPNPTGFEFQRLHGMGEALYETLRKTKGGDIACRIYAPVGGYRDLLAYLVRRLLENGANSSFVAQVGDADVPIENLLQRPRDLLAEGPARHPKIVLPRDIFAPRQNSAGVAFGERKALASFLAERDAAGPLDVTARCFWSGAKADAPQVIRSAVDGTAIGSVHALGAEAASALVGEAARHVRTAEAVPAATRAGWLRKAADLMEAREGLLMNLLAREAGKTVDDGIAEIREAVDFLRFYAAEAERLFAAPTFLPGPTGEENVLQYRSRGVAVCISPWNFPLAIFTGQVAAALAAGNVVIAKPAEQTPLIAAIAVGLLHEAGFPATSLYLAPGDGKAGAALVAHKATAAVAFTGSTETAFAINRALAARDAPIAPLIAETGGINAMIVDATALPEQVADDVVMSAFRSTGQRCSALRLLFVQEEVADAMVEMIAGAAAELTVGDPRDIATDMGPVIDAAQHTMLSEHLDRMGREQRIRFAGTLPEGLPAAGQWFAPHIVELDRAEALPGEVFGPILHVVRWKAGGLEAVCDAIERTGFGLTLGIHSRIDDVARLVRERLTVGNVYINRNMIGAIVGSQPFGGSGLSGTGPKAGGPNYVARFTREQVVSVNTAAAGGNASLIAMEA
ncbi:MAG: bifunctional proline dehydrogenase/L-glutamate gamma-semialdehyde dehydrogenase PutA [Aurantimonas endophytica]|uniref:Bifunctional protein PutA n=1 Tax=Aurantimonas endophytica TaxID=1522175 RepID=A0A7W6HC46_9HYPH|nr:bifunctional proline dehydrogenase/L-glutamate gamma-semialdehyde dehydrogenase PutA [Aurantimonas endophytica]MBB4002441.1 RHH-type proline utilization regulon transcriptional repressor/proline dehydrogenase/delta 1-pyrroline-5-carboxylate dehydrogenase [Aurantimonas endophytica]MCO6401938.1 bifunctional proline dehydrogenase/L-glutamate gamma-semialdehyde dehydrogenase PutA [Aurantimonas endophytica]